MNSVGLNGLKIVNNVSIFNDSVVINSHFKDQYGDEQCFLQYSCDEQ